MKTKKWDITVSSCLIICAVIVFFCIPDENTAGYVVQYVFGGILMHAVHKIENALKEDEN